MAIARLDVPVAVHGTAIGRSTARTSRAPRLHIPFRSMTLRRRSAPRWGDDSSNCWCRLDPIGGARAVGEPVTVRLGGEIGLAGGKERGTTVEGRKMEIGEQRKHERLEIARQAPGKYASQATMAASSSTSTKRFFRNLRQHEVDVLLRQLVERSRSWPRPASTAFTRMSWAANSLPSDLVSAIRPAFEAE